jgi:uracil-DNA glycosylase
MTFVPAYRPVTIATAGLDAQTVAAGPTIASQLPPDWRDALKEELKKPYIKKLEHFLAAERKRTDVKIEPPKADVFAALKRTPVAEVKVVLLGQDPYPNSGDANGLAFSVRPGRAIPGSLQNMLNVAVLDDVMTKVPDNGDLGPWADQGVLLINTVLTVRAGAPNSHKDKGWEQFTQAILDVVNKKNERVVFMLLGKQAQSVEPRIDTSRHAIVKAPHPSPANPGNPFKKTRPFSAVNKALGPSREIDWTLPDLHDHGPL